MARHCVREFRPGQKVICWHLLNFAELLTIAEEGKTWNALAFGKYRTVPEWSTGTTTLRIFHDHEGQDLRICV